MLRKTNKPREQTRACGHKGRNGIKDLSYTFIAVYIYTVVVIAAKQNVFYSLQNREIKHLLISSFVLSSMWPCFEIYIYICIKRHNDKHEEIKMDIFSFHPTHKSLAWGKNAKRIF